MIKALLLFAFLFSGFLFGQQRDIISILGVESKTPVVRAHVFSSSFNTITSELGQCIIPPHLNNVDSITISCIGYKTVKIAYQDIKPVILLEPDIIILDEVVIVAFNEADTISKAKSLIPFNHKQDGDHIGFFKNLRFKNDTLRSVAELTLIYYLDKHSKTKIILQEILKSEDSLHNMNFKTTPYSMVSGRLETSSLFDTVYYQYKYNGMLKDNQVYEFQFQAKSTALLEKAPAIGKMYLNVSDLGIAKIEAAYHKDYKGMILHHKISKGNEVEIKAHHISTILDFVKKDGKMVLLNRADLVIDDRTYTINNETDRYVFYKQLFIKEVKERSKYKRKDVLDKNISIYSLSDSDYNIHEIEGLPTVSLPKLEDEEDIRLYFKSLQEVIHLKEQNNQD